MPQANQPEDDTAPAQSAFDRDSAEGRATGR